MKVENLRFFEALDGLIGSKYGNNYGRFEHYIAGCEDLGELLFQFMLYFDFWAINMASDFMSVKYHCWEREQNINYVLYLYKRLFFCNFKLLDRLGKFRIIRNYEWKVSVSKKRDIRLLEYYMKHVNIHTLIIKNTKVVRDNIHIINSCKVVSEICFLDMQSNGGDIVKDVLDGRELDTLCLLNTRVKGNALAGLKSLRLLWIPGCGKVNYCSFEMLSRLGVSKVKGGNVHFTD